MITSTQQRNLVADRIEALRQRLDTTPKAGVPSHIAAMEAAQVTEEIEELSADLEEYDRACSADLATYVFDTYEAFLKFPIVIRLAKHMSQQEFAEFVGVSLSQLKRYEAETYRNAPTHVVNQVLQRFKLQYSARISQAS